MRIHPEQLWRSRTRNWLQTLLIVTGLACVMAVPGWVLLGGNGVVWALGFTALALLLSSRVPSRVILARSGAGLLHRRQAPRLYAVLDTLYRRADIPIAPALYYVPGRSLNAFAVGDRRDGGIAVTDGLLSRLDLRQLTGVLAHEVSHLRNGDTRVMAMAAAMTRLTVWGATAVQVLVILLLPALVAGEVTLPWLALLVVAIAPTVSSLLQLALSRNREYKADLEAVALTGDAAGLAAALRTLEHHNGGWLHSLFGRRQPAWIRWLQTHPPTEERIRRLLSLAGSQPPREDHQRLPPRQPRIVIRHTPPPLGSRYWISRRF